MSEKMERIRKYEEKRKNNELTDKEVCKLCSYKSGDTCTHPPNPKPIDEVEGCNRWDAKCPYYTTNPDIPLFEDQPCEFYDEERCGSCTRNPQYFD